MPEPNQPANNWFHAILFHLYEKYPLDDQPKNINDFLINELGIKNNDFHDAHNIRKVLEYLMKKDYIFWEASPTVLGASAFGVSSPEDANKRHPTRNLEFHVIRAKLTLEGFAYCSEVARNSELHESIIKTNKKTIRMSRYTLFVAIAAIVVALLPFFKNEKDTVLTVPQPLQLDTVITQPLQSPKENRVQPADSPHTTSKNVSITPSGRSVNK